MVEGKAADIDVEDKRDQEGGRLQRSRGAMEKKKREGERQKDEKMHPYTRTTKATTEGSSDPSNTITFTQSPTPRR
jgi:hypothetical protein